MFEPYSILYALVKGAVFAFLITTISAYWGYYAKGNSLEVGRASTHAVVASSVAIMIFDLILTQIMRV
jgi:phospholipid/cholesterol/gamma-HCH transport system permease protein